MVKKIYIKHYDMIRYLMNIYIKHYDMIRYLINENYL